VEVIPILDTIDLHYLILFRDEMPPNGLRDADDEESGGHTRAGQKPKNKKD
jgi:hypothetical protein